MSEHEHDPIHLLPPDPGTDTLLVTLLDGSTHVFPATASADIEHDYLSVTIANNTVALFAPNGWAAVVWDTPDT